MAFKIICLIIPIICLFLTLGQFKKAEEKTERTIAKFLILFHAICLVYPSLFFLWIIFISQVLFLIALFTLVKSDGKITGLYYYLPASILLITQEICKY